MFRSPREALQTMYKKHDGRGHRSQTYTDRVDSSHVAQSEHVLLASLLYGVRGVARAPMDFPKHPDRWGEWLEDLTLQTWCFNRCYLCGRNTVYGDDHACDRGPEKGKPFWTPARRRVIERTMKWLRGELRDLNLMSPPVRVPKTTRRPVLEDDQVLAFDENHEIVDGHGLTPPRTLRIDDTGTNE